MDEATVLRLNAINRAFYASTASDFHATRGSPWQGWERLLPHVSDSPRVLDVGCGNGRFGIFLIENQRLPLIYHGLDNNAALLTFARAAIAGHAGVEAALREYDLIEYLVAPSSTAIADEQYELVALFGVMHHIPGVAQRQQLMRALASCVKPGGILALACWRFYEQARFRKRIIPWDSELAAQVEPGDHLLDWKRGTPALRYCHYVNDAELAALIAASGMREIERYRADGETGDANLYSVLRA